MGVLTMTKALGATSPELVTNVLSAFFNTMWNKADPLHRKIKFVLLKGEVAPKAFVMVKTPGYCNAQLLAPMISPELCGKQMGIYHGDASVLLRTEIAGVMLMKTPENKNAVVRKANEISTSILVKMLRVTLSQCTRSRSAVSSELKNRTSHERSCDFWPNVL